ncbi:hypothetical protein ACJRO7_024259 [Eucalyptus globulus]|uniref:PHD-type zinc finger plants domain-containing protein n=1 Tax=Eucalyptus globulus TaxID=34317 RepID=A0ABD3KAP8_EUCGL
MKHQAKGMTSIAMATATTTSNECCMCGDHGLPEELFQCKICHFRSQHRYCSNLYPKAKSYRLCNWCLAQNQDGSSSKERTNKSSNHSSARKNGACEEESNEKSKKRNNKGRKIGYRDDHGDPKGETTDSLQFPCAKKQKKPLQSLAPTIRKRIISSGDLEEKRRREKEEERSKSDSNVGVGMGKRAVLRSKRVIRRYKLLDEVSS